MSEERYLRDELTAYAKSGAYPFHMPGHKRQLSGSNPYELDITEIAGFDNLHHAKDILREEQNRAAQLYGADRSFYLVNGSTCGILAAISAAVPRGGHVLVARNCHKSVYHALQLREAAVTYVYPVMTHVGICGQIRVTDVEDAIRLWDDRASASQNDSVNLSGGAAQRFREEMGAGKDAPFCAIIVTSPTYDGVVSDIKGLAQLAHRYGIPLIVDAAHGAHFGFAPHFPENPLRLGADACIVSVHKTLPAFTQTALLLLQGERVAAERVEEYLDIYETSSPSYVLMAGISDSIRFMERQGADRLRTLAARLELFYERMAELQHLHVLQKKDFSQGEVFDFDFSKILILTAQAGISGVELSERLREQEGLELEMACGTYALALTTMMDTEEGFRRLEDALRRIDAQLQGEDAQLQGEDAGTSAVIQSGGSDMDIPFREATPDAQGAIGDTVFHFPEQVLSIAEAAESDGIEVPYREALGAVSRSMVVPYPPGIPAIVPGERIDSRMIAEIDRCLAIGIEVEGLTENHRIKIVNF